MRMLVLLGRRLSKRGRRNSEQTVYYSSSDEADDQRIVDDLVGNFHTCILHIYASDNVHSDSFLDGGEGSTTQGWKSRKIAHYDSAT